MANETLLTPLNFNDSLIGQSWNDKKTGLEILIGYISGLPADLADLPYASGDIGLALMDRGIGQKELDIACQKLSGDTQNEGYQLLVTKSDSPFDNRWFLIGNLIDIIEAAKIDRITLPFSNFLYDDIANHLDRYKR